MSVNPQKAVDAVFSHLAGTPSVQAAQNQASARSAISNLDLTDPSSYMMSAWDLAQYNNKTSQAMAREQMAFQERANAQAMAFSASEAQKVRDWQSMLSDTAHQREVADLLAAGLNPILSANNGAAVGSAPAAQGVTSSGAKGSVDLGAMSALVNIWTQAKQVEMQEKSLDVQTALNLINNETNRYMADRSAAASIYGSGAMASAQRYGAYMSNLASQYAADLNYSIYAEGMHSPFSQLIEYLGDFMGKGQSSGKTVNDVQKNGSFWGTFLDQLKGKSLFGKPSSADSFINPNWLRNLLDGSRGSSVK